MKSQGRLLIAALKRRAHTYKEMLDLDLGTSPWRRVVEGLKPHEAIKKGERRGLVTWRVVSARR